VRVGVIGCGYWGPHLIRNFAHHPLAQVDIVCDTRYERAVRVGGQYRIPHITDSADDVVQSAECDLVVIATPCFTHYTLAKAALQASTCWS
jgi:predicted dehydrogenase